MIFKRRTTKFGTLVYESEDGRAVITAWKSIPPPYRISVYGRAGSTTRIVRSRRRHRCYSVRVDGKVIERRVWHLGEAKEVASEALRETAA